MQIVKHFLPHRIHPLSIPIDNPSGQRRRGKEGKIKKISIHSSSSNNNKQRRSVGRDFFPPNINNFCLELERVRRVSRTTTTHDNKEHFCISKIPVLESDFLSHFSLDATCDRRNFMLVSIRLFSPS